MSESAKVNQPVASKVEGLHAFTRAGYRTFAVIDDEPAVIRALAEADDAARSSIDTPEQPRTLDGSSARHGRWSPLRPHCSGRGR